MTAQSSFFSDSGFTKHGKRIPLVDAVCGLARRLWPSKTAVIRFDPATQEIMVDRWFSHSQIATEKHMQGARRMIADINSDEIREAMEYALSAFEASREKPRNTQEDRGSRLVNSTYLNPRGK